MRSHTLCAIDRCPISSPKLNECIAALNRMARDRRWPPFLATAELFTNESQVQFNVLSTGRPLAQRFFDWCGEEMSGLVSGALEYDGYRVSYGSFFQVNRFLVRPLVDAVTADAVIGEAAPGETAIDLYAGAGLFSVPLAGRFQKVIAVESGNSAARDLAFNATRAGAAIEVRAESADAFLNSWLETPDFVVADPPRTGLGKSVVARLCELKPRAITVVACDPSTLARDAQALTAGGYRLDGLTLIDLFPQTYHIETLARFRLADA
jgi:23S rRNA (uracil1939-C5)-methyltransferase